ncbi:MAG: molybdate ABC transporter substrate-binding protein, partial [Pseudomonadota bacterium]
AGARSPAPDPPPSLAAYDLPSRLGDGRLAVALTAAVPAGRYAREALGALGLWTALAPRLVETEDVRGALALAARAEVPYALVYATDAAAEPRVAVAARVPAEAHAPILYLAAATQETPGAAAWLDWLGGPRGRALFARHGFAPPPARPAPQ